MAARPSIPVPGIRLRPRVLLVLQAILVCLATRAAEVPPIIRSDPPSLSNHTATVLLFIQPDCPISNQYAPAINRLHTAFSPRDVVFYLVYPDAALTEPEVRAHLESYQLSCPAALDPGHRLVKAAGATRTPEAAVFDRAGRQIYRGRIDNRYIDFGKKRPAPTREDLRLALESVLAGRPVKPAVTRAVGCYIGGE